ncbi:MAG: hypothetical protein KIT84_24930 [Labilithrix sp.]|nr:hypothetical protein [Labilithrix sp.]MCW5814295.1 hypothetical protein [Labilithrix sp.]
MPGPVAQPSVRVDAGVVDMTPAPGADVPSLDELAARGATDAPLMREAKRIDDASTPVELDTSAADTCFRALVASSRPVKAWFADATNAPRGEVADAAGLVPPRGPACAKKGEALRLVIDATTPGTLTRAVVWQGYSSTSGALPPTPPPQTRPGEDAGALRAR